MISVLEKLVVILLVLVVGWLAFKRSQRQSVLVENARRLKIVNELLVLLERAGDLLPSDKLSHLLSELPEFLEVDVTVWQSAK